MTARLHKPLEDTNAVYLYQGTKPNIYKTLFVKPKGRRQFWRPRSKWKRIHNQ